MRKPPPARRLAVAGLVVATAAARADPAQEQEPFARLLADHAIVAPVEPVTAAPAGLLGRSGDRAADLVIRAMNFLGVPYRRGGGTAEAGFDCSGFTRHVFEHGLGLVLPRRVDDQASAPGLMAVPRDALQPGDLVFFNTLRRTFSHVGIYLGDGKFIHAPRPGSQVRVESMRFSYWTRRFTGARRALAVADAAPTPSNP
jgi:cell wall-associated NlpC family hydrolase